MIQETYNTILYRLTKFVEGHNLLKQFTHGNLLEMSEKLGEADYPLLHVIPESVQYDAGSRTFTMKIVIADIAREIDNRANYQKEVLSDMIRIGEDLIAEIKNGKILFGDEVEIGVPITFTPFLADYTHTMTGVTIDIDMTFPYNWSACDIPAEWTPIGGGGGPTGDCCINLRVNGTDNVVQQILDLVAGDNMTIVDNGDGTVTFSSSGGGGGSVSWGDIIGNLPDQIDLQNAFDLKADISSLSLVAFSNDYNDLSNLPTIPAAQVNSDWNAASGVEQILNKPILAEVATSGDYNDLLNLPTIPDVSGFVPYTGATQDVDLDANKLSAKSVYIEGTGGDGHLHLKHQSADATATGQSTSLWADSNGDIKWKNDGDYKTTLKSSLNTADRVYTLPNETCELLPRNPAIVGDTKTKIKYDSDGLVLEGSDIVAADISDSTTVGRSLVTLTNPSAIRYLRINANNSVTAIDSTTLKSELGIASGTTFQLVTTSDQASNSTAAIVVYDITGLTFPITSGKRYKFKALLLHTANSTFVSIRIGINANVGVTSVNQQICIVTTPSGSPVENRFNLNSLGVVTFAGANSTAQWMSTVEGILIANNNGTASIQFSKGAPNGGTLTIKAGSILEYFEI